MRSCFALGLVLALASTGQTLVNLRRDPNGGSATYRPTDSVHPVLNAPVAYELREVRVQTLADGAHITQVMRLERFWRDSHGRTRLERSYPAPRNAENGQTSAWPTAEITNPAVGFWYLLETEKKLAHRGPLPPPTPAPSTPPLPPTAVSEDLGKQTINGVVAQGRRTILTVPMNAQGNDRPLITTTEIWTSPELQITMLRNIHDPRVGDATTELHNFKREFAPPPDYRIVDESGQFTVSWGTLPAPANSPDPSGAYRMGPGVSPPVPIYQPEPRYTEQASRAKIQGSVSLSLIVDAEGRPQRVQVVRSLDPGLDQQAIEAVSQWRFRPGQKDGMPVPVIASVQVFFRLLDNPQR